MTAYSLQPSGPDPHVSVLFHCVWESVESDGSFPLPSNTPGHNADFFF